jgi:hypothetical protein
MWRCMCALSEGESGGSVLDVDVMCARSEGESDGSVLDVDIHVC